ncbi:GntR family transcriptional regulator [Promicromonospora sp. NPDC023805]|uniref:GntR family transcriptional regulator n=1 Tax=Promicromonospora sp. NPDC023805 TaxID=3154696 RepID=UPI0033CC8E32
MEIQVDTGSPVPHYEQIRAQVTRLVLTGALPQGTRLPPIRQLAGHLGLSNGAVARAYRELEREGTVLTAGKKGTTIAPIDQADGATARDKDRRQALTDAAGTYAITAYRLGYTLDAAVAVLAKAMASEAEEQRT